MTIKSKVFAMVAAPMAGIIALAGLGWWGLGQMAETMNQLVDRQLVPIIDQDMERLARINQAIGLTQGADRAAYQAVLAERQALEAASIDDFKAFAQENAAKLDQVRQAVDQAVQHLPAGAAAERQAFDDAYGAWQELSRRMVALAEDGQHLKARALISESFAAFQTMRQRMKAVTDLLAQQVEAVRQQVRAKRDEAQASAAQARQDSQILALTLVAAAALLL